MRTILIIDDDTAIIDVLKTELTQAFPGAVCHDEAVFANAVERVRQLRPDVVILDLRQGAFGTDLQGQITWRSLWNDRFCPVVIYTAVDDPIDPPVPQNHPFVVRLRKGAGTEQEVIRLLQGFVPHVEAINHLHDELDRVVQRVLLETAGEAVLTGANAVHLVHSARRRVAAKMDEATLSGGRSLFAWEQYLIPPIGEDPLTGDILLREGGSASDPTSYRLVLSPSCDLVRSRNEPTVLVAKCSRLGDFTAGLSLPNNEAKARERLRTLVLSQGFANGWFPLPAFNCQVPAMAACLKDLEVLPYECIVPPDGSDQRFRRVASIDSPFRELVSWAFVNTVARPGMPDRDLDAWATEIVGSVTRATGPPSPNP